MTGKVMHKDCDGLMIYLDETALTVMCFGCGLLKTFETREQTRDWLKDNAVVLEPREARR
jgi:hypothetical protein